MPRHLMSYFPLKRFFDFLLALFLLILFAPLIVVVLFVVSVILLESPLFVQKRIGRSGLPFEMYKIKSMKSGSDTVSPGIVMRFIRNTGIDELPQLWNVLKGEMSMVGPRPLPVYYRKLMKKEHMRREDVQPGLTGLSQVSGGNGLSWQDRFELDLKYVERINLWLDIRILLSTFPVILSKRSTDSAVLSKNY